MKPCQICSGYIQRRIKVSGEAILLSSARTTCIKCRPYKSTKGRQLDTTRRQIVNGLEIRCCTKCNEWRDPDCYHHTTGLICKKCYKASYTFSQKRVDLKLRAVRYKGSKCQRCNKTFPICAYSFHHRDPTAKDFAINKAGYLWNQMIQTELDKCDLLCHNCHSIKHVKNESYLQKP